MMYLLSFSSLSCQAFFILLICFFSYHYVFHSCFFLLLCPLDLFVCLLLLLMLIWCYDVYVGESCFPPFEGLLQRAYLVTMCMFGHTYMHTYGGIYTCIACRQKKYTRDKSAHINLTYIPASNTMIVRQSHVFVLHAHHFYIVFLETQIFFTLLSFPCSPNAVSEPVDLTWLLQVQRHFLELRCQVWL